MRKLRDLFYFAAVVAGGFVAQRAFGADAPPAAPTWLPGLGTILEHPAVIALGAELATRLAPTRRKTSLFFLLRELLRFLAAVCDRLAQSPVAQVQRKPRRSKAAAAAAGTPAAAPKDPTA